MKNISYFVPHCYTATYSAMSASFQIMSVPASPSKTEGIFIANALDKILKDKEVKRSQNQLLRQACERALSK